jgi:hypothetical protein
MMQCNHQRFAIQEISFVYTAFGANINVNKLGKINAGLSFQRRPTELTRTVKVIAL